MKQIIPIILIHLIFANLCYSQERIEGRIVNSESGEPVPYVNIGIINQMSGTVSDSEGNFRLEYRSEADSLVISAIGYQREKLSIRKVLQNPVLMLLPVTYTLDEVIVEEKALGEIQELGYNLQRRRQSIGFGSTQLGTEIGALIPIDKETLVEKAFFIFERSGGEQLLFRVNLYEFNDGSEGDNLIPENVFLESPASPGTISVDLSTYHILADTDVLLTLEWVDTVTLEENRLQGISFRADESRRGSNTYLKATSFAPFTSTDPFVQYRLGFYITARQVK